MKDADGLERFLKDKGYETIERTETYIIVQAGADADPSPAKTSGTSSKKKSTKKKGLPEAEFSADGELYPDGWDGKTTDKDYFYWDQAQKARLQALLDAGYHIWAGGETGTGKTETFIRLFEEKGIEYRKMSCNGEQSIDNLIGTRELDEGEKGATVTASRYGALQLTMKAGIPLILEEADTAPPEVNTVLHGVTERRPGKPAVYYDDRLDELIEAQPGWSIVITANTVGGGDHTGRYRSSQPQSAAFVNRFAVELFDFPEKTVEEMILRRRTGIDAALAANAVALANAARDEMRKGQMYTPIGTRSIVLFSELCTVYEAAGLSKQASIEGAMGNFIINVAANPSDRAALAGMIQRIFGIKIKIKDSK
jgi:nitric oxide reductase NorQ protein